MSNNLSDFVAVLRSRVTYRLHEVSMRAITPAPFAAGEEQHFIFEHTF